MAGTGKADEVKASEGQGLYPHPSSEVEGVTTNSFVYFGIFCAWVLH